MIIHMSFIAVDTGNAVTVKFQHSPLVSTVPDIKYQLVQCYFGCLIVLDVYLCCQNIWFLIDTNTKIQEQKLLISSFQGQEITEVPAGCLTSRSLW